MTAISIAVERADTDELRQLLLSRSIDPVRARVVRVMELAIDIDQDVQRTSWRLGWAR
jgi:hypothetical protein